MTWMTENLTQTWLRIVFKRRNWFRWWINMQVLYWTRNKRTGLEGEAFVLPVNVHFNPSMVMRSGWRFSKVRLQIQTTKMSHRHSSAGLSHRDRVRNLDIRRDPRVKPLLWCLLGTSLWGFSDTPSWEGTPRTCWQDYMFHLAWKRLSLPQGVTCCWGEGWLKHSA